MVSKGRKKGDWVSVARGRANKVRDLVRGNGVSNIPRATDTGSAAYRRLTQPKKKVK